MLIFVQNAQITENAVPRGVPGRRGICYNGAKATTPEAGGTETPRPERSGHEKTGSWTFDGGAGADPGEHRPGRRPRLRLAAEADFAICLYNPSSKKRADYLRKACEIMLEAKGEDTVCGIVSQIGREGESMQVLTLRELKDTQVDMFTTVFIGNSQTMEINGRMVTPRGYRYE